MRREIEKWDVVGQKLIENASGRIGKFKALLRVVRPGSRNQRGSLALRAVPCRINLSSQSAKGAAEAINLAE